jgi:ribonuclease HI
VWEWFWYWCSVNFASGANFELSFPIEASATNNQAEYRAILKGFQLLREIEADAVEVFGDSMLVIN